MARVALACALVLFMSAACVRKPVPVTAESDPSARREYPIVVDPAPWRDMSPEARRAAQEAAFAKILERVDLGQEQILRKYLLGEGLGTGVNMSVGSYDPEMARLTGVVLSIRVAERPAAPPPP